MVTDGCKSTVSPVESQERLDTGIHARCLRLQRDAWCHFNAICTPASVDDWLAPEMTCHDFIMSAFYYHNKGQKPTFVC